MDSSAGNVGNAIAGTAVFADRLGTNRVFGARFYPYGDEITSPQTSSDRVKFATYTRDSFTGLDYADQRFYASSFSALRRNPTTCPKSQLSQGRICG